MKLSAGMCRRLSRRSFLGQTALATVGLAAAGCVGGKIAPAPISGIASIALSPDGHKIAARFEDARTIVLYDWTTGEVTRIPHAPDTTMDYPAVSPDGQSLAFIQFDRQKRPGSVALVDLRTLETRILPGDQVTADFERFEPRFSPDGRRLVYGVQRIAAPNGIVLLDRDGAPPRELLNPALGFYSVSDFCFVAPNEILFQGRAPRDSEFVEYIAALGRNKVDNVQYRLRFDAKPGPGFDRPEIMVPQLDPRPGNTADIRQLCASRDGPQLAWLNDRAIFERRDGLTTQVAGRTGLTFGCAISSDGGTIAITENPGLIDDYDLTILDRRTGAIIATHLLAKLRAS